MDAKKKPRDRRERFYCAYADMLGARRKGDPGKRRPGECWNGGREVEVRRRSWTRSLPYRAKMIARWRDKQRTTESAEVRRGHGGAGGRARP
jgi:hypothetical protein